MDGPGKTSAYKSAGVDIDAQEKGLARVKELARATFTGGVLSEIGSFGGLFRPDLQGLSEPVLVASADGVGTKLAVARMAGDYSTVGRDLVNHCVNDIADGRVFSGQERQFQLGAHAVGGGNQHRLAVTLESEAPAEAADIG